MEKTGRVLAWLHRAVLAALAVLTLPVLLALYLADLSAGAARIMERVSPCWGWLMGAWFAAGAYFCGCLVLSPGFREGLLTRISGFRERDEREDLLTAKAARSVFLLTLGCFLAAGLVGMVRLNVFSYTRWAGGRVPPLAKVGPYELRRGTVAKRGFVLWPGIGIPSRRNFPSYVEREIGDTEYFYDGGSMFEPEISRTFFALAAVQVLLFQLFARRLRV